MESIRVSAKIADLNTGDGHPLLVIAGPCVIENESLTREIAERVQQICVGRPVSFIFKASFDKANRTSLSSYRGPGLENGLKILKGIRDDLHLPVTTDIHEPGQAEQVANVCDLIQIPAFLARQTDLLVAAAATGKAVNVKKGQFMAPTDMRFVMNKLTESGCRNLMATERGTFFGYGKLVNDFTGLVSMRSLGYPVVFDATHSVQQPGSASGITLGNREMVAPLARAAVAVGVDAVFLETHPDPSSSPSDAANIFPLDQLADLLDCLVSIRQCSTTTTNLQSGPASAE